MHGYGLSSGRLNLDSTKFVASKLAKFHAASLYLDREVVSRVVHKNFDDNLSKNSREKAFNIIKMVYLISSRATASTS